MTYPVIEKKQQMHINFTYPPFLIHNFSNIFQRCLVGSKIVCPGHMMVTLGSSAWFPRWFVVFKSPRILFSHGHFFHFWGWQPRSWSELTTTKDISYKDISVVLLSEFRILFPVTKHMISSSSQTSVHHSLDSRLT